MLKILFVIGLIMLIGVSTNYAYSEEINLSTFQETAQIIIDKKISEETSASITLLSSNIQEIIIPSELEQKIRNHERIQAIVITNHENCVLGVNQNSCIIINVERDPNDKGIVAIQESTRIIGDKYIEDINNLFDTEAKFFQIFIHTSDEANKALETSGIISGSGTISAVYTMPMEDTNSMYGKLSSMLLSKSIRTGEGFYDVAKNLANDENARMSFSIIPSEEKSLFQLKLSTNYPIDESSQINPMEFLQVENLKRSTYFSSGNYPLNSIFQLVILSNENITISNIMGDIIPTKLIDGINIPTEITKKGWVFDPQQGEYIQAKYLFGQSSSINQNELKFSIANEDIKLQTTEMNEESEDSIIIVGIIALVSILAALFYLKGYKK